VSGDAECWLASEIIRSRGRKLDSVYFHILPALGFVCFNAFELSAGWASTWQNLLWAVQVINLTVLLLPAIWTVIVSRNRYPHHLFLIVTLVLVLVMWVANFGFWELLPNACPTCRFGWQGS
jgi:hypothetical protein